MDFDWTLTLIIGAALGALVMIANRVEKIQKDTAAIREFLSEIHEALDGPGGSKQRHVARNAIFARRDP
jgi:hypothetical protein